MAAPCGSGDGVVEVYKGSPPHLNINDHWLPAAPPELRKKVLIFGDSFVKRLNNFLQVNQQFKAFGLGECLDIQFLGLSGADVGAIRESPKVGRVIQSFAPDVLLLNIGSNDLCLAQTKADVWKIGYDIITLAETLLQAPGVRFVLILQCLPRTVPSIYVPNLQQYNGFSADLSHYLSVTASDNAKIKFFFLPQITKRISRLTTMDGVHLTDEGNFKFCRSLKFAVLHAVKSSTHS
jgi:lysophospholipase L1-like esterase